MHGDAGPHPPAALPVVGERISFFDALFGKKPFHLLRVHAQSIFVTVHENRVGATINNRADGRHKGKGRAKHFIIRLNTAQKKRNMDCGGTVDSGHSILGTGVISDCPFKLVHVLTNRRNPSRIQALLHIFPFAPPETWCMKGNVSRRPIVNPPDGLFNYRYDFLCVNHSKSIYYMMIHLHSFL